MQQISEKIKFSFIPELNAQLPEIDDNITLFILFPGRLVYLHKSLSSIYYNMNYYCAITSEYCDIGKLLLHDDYKKINMLTKIINHDFCNDQISEHKVVLENGKCIILKRKHDIFNVKMYDSLEIYENNPENFITKSNIPSECIKKNIHFAYYLKPLVTKSARKI